MREYQNFASLPGKETKKYVSHPFGNHSPSTVGGAPSLEQKLLSVRHRGSDESTSSARSVCCTQNTRCKHQDGASTKG